MAGDRGIGLLEAYAKQERPWSRTDIHCARILSYQLGLVVGGALDGLAPGAVRGHTFGGVPVG